MFATKDFNVLHFHGITVHTPAQPRGESVSSAFNQPHFASLCSRWACRVRIHDLRTDRTALLLSAHQFGVSAVQMDDWKVVSGGEEGLVSVWDYRMNQKLWEVHSRYGCSLGLFSNNCHPLSQVLS